jgi:hypothetical protein
MEGEGLGVVSPEAVAFKQMSVLSPGGERGVLLEGKVGRETPQTPSEIKPKDQDEHPEQKEDGDKSTIEVAKDTADYLAEYKDRLSKLSARKRVTGYTFGTAKEIIERRQRNGKYRDDESREKVASALALNGEGGVTVEASNSLKDVIDLLEDAKKENGELEEAAKDTLSEITPYVRIALTDSDGIIKKYSLSEWRQKLETVFSEERLKLEQDGLYCFEFPEEGTDQQENTPKKTLDGALDEHEQRLIEKIKEAKDKKEDTTEDETLLVKIRFAKEAKNGIGSYFKQKLLLEFKAAGAEGLDELIDVINEEAIIGMQKLTKFLEEKGVKQDELDKIVKGDLDSLIQSGAAKKLEGFDELIFGRKMTEEEVAKILSGSMDKDKIASFITAHKKDIGLGILGLLLLAVMGGMQAVEGLGRQQR